MMFIVRPGVDPSVPFSRYHAAGLTNAQFGVDGTDPWFRGYHNASRSWNGWAIPKFRPKVAALIVDWVNESQPSTARWISSTIAVRDDSSEVCIVEPDSLGLHQFDGWAWLEANLTT
jgi:hypothetical protein